MEPWVDDSQVRALSHYIAFHVLTSLAAGDDDNAQEEQDEQVFCLLNPQLMERIWKSGSIGEIVHYRLATAAAMGIDKLISQWIRAYGSIEAVGPEGHEL